jgi:hypothetical protein
MKLASLDRLLNIPRLFHVYERHMPIKHALILCATVHMSTNIPLAWHLIYLIVNYTVIFSAQKSPPTEKSSPFTSFLTHEILRLVFWQMVLHHSRSGNRLLGQSFYSITIYHLMFECMGGISLTLVPFLDQRSQRTQILICFQLCKS